MNKSKFPVEPSEGVIKVVSQISQKMKPVTPDKYRQQLREISGAFGPDVDPQKSREMNKRFEDYSTQKEKN